MNGKNNFTKIIYVIPIVLILSSVTNSSAAIDKTKVGVEVGDVYQYTLLAFNDDYDGETTTCVACDDRTGDIEMSPGDQYTMEITDIVANSFVKVKLVKGEQEITHTQFLDRRTESNILYTDWDFWPDRIDEDWDWVYDLEANVSFFGSEDIVSFTPEIIHQVEGDVFNTVLKYETLFNSNIDTQSFNVDQHIEYDLETGVVNFFVINQTQSFWNGTVMNFYEKAVSEKLVIESSTSSDSIIGLNWLLLSFGVLVITKKYRN